MRVYLEDGTFVGKADDVMTDINKVKVNGVEYKVLKSNLGTKRLTVEARRQPDSPRRSDRQANMKSSKHETRMP